MPSLTKEQKRRVRALAAEAHARELTSALEALGQEFQRRERDEISVFELSDKVHRFHNGISRELHARYAMDSAEFGVIYALRHRVLSRNEVGADLISALGMKAEDLGLAS